MILVTGATGFLGAAICRRLLDEGESFLALRRDNSKINLLDDVADRIHWVTGDIRDVSGLEKLMDDVTEVIHSAAVVSFDSKDFDLMDEVNVEGTRNLVNLCLSKKVKRFIFISSIAAIGRAESARS